MNTERKTVSVEDIYTREEAATILNLRKQTITNYASRYKIGRKFGGILVFTLDDIDVIRQHMDRGPGRQSANK